jgi:hypothetical protein
VFTSAFFRRDLPGILSAVTQAAELAWSRDAFNYHPENDQATFLIERHPRLLRCPVRFHYYVDDAGLAEIVIDAPSLGRRELSFATRLFCLQNAVRAATLDGKRISAAAIPI